MAKKKAKKAIKKPATKRPPASKAAAGARKKTSARKAAPAAKKSAARKPSPARPARSAPSRSKNPIRERVIDIPPTVQIGEIPSGLGKADISELRAALLRKRQEILGDVTTMRDEALSRNRQDAAGDLSNMPLHPADVGSDHYEQEFTLGLIESERQIIREIDEALMRIEKGTFGICAATGQPIGLARLRVMPWAKYCYEYVLAQERGRWPRR